MNRENLWAPWRMAYLRDLDRRAEERRDRATVDASPCFLSAYWAAPDRDVEHLVVHRDAHGMILLNRYPYANGHLLVALGEPRGRLLDYDDGQRAALWSLVDHATRLVEATLHPQGVNIGVNQGAAAGAGVPEHLHAHVVPRWAGDTNFMSVVGDLRVIPEALESMAAQYREAALALRSEG
ncbi:MAG: HIT domain-containing protein [Phycisphaerales bacterium]|nr:HIT domain-containing protein [Phycisphaerales bacterium]